MVTTTGAEMMRTAAFATAHCYETMLHRHMAAARRTAPDTREELDHKLSALHNAQQVVAALERDIGLLGFGHNGKLEPA